VTDGGEAVATSWPKVIRRRSLPIQARYRPGLREYEAATWAVHPSPPNPSLRIASPPTPLPLAREEGDIGSSLTCSPEAEAFIR